ncbi:MAG: outer membrane beta-barrel protein [Pseudomonadota bacterium]
MIRNTAASGSGRSIPRWITSVVALTVSLALMPSLAQAQYARAPVPPAYLQVDLGGVLESGDQEAETGFLVGLRGGFNFTTTTSIEAELFRDEMSFDAGFDLEHTGFAVNLVRYNRVPLWNPYVLLGIGGLRFELPGDSDTEYMAHVGVGGQWDLTESGVLLRAELRYRYSPLRSSLEGVLEDASPVFTVGLVMPLGL